MVPKTITKTPLTRVTCGTVSRDRQWFTSGEASCAASPAPAQGNRPLLGAEDKTHAAKSSIIPSCVAVELVNCALAPKLQLRHYSLSTCSKLRRLLSASPVLSWPGDGALRRRGQCGGGSRSGMATIRKPRKLVCGVDASCRASASGPDGTYKRPWMPTPGRAMAAALFGAPGPGWIRDLTPANVSPPSPACRRYMLGRTPPRTSAAIRLVGNASALVQQPSYDGQGMMVNWTWAGWHPPSLQGSRRQSRDLQSRAPTPSSTWPIAIGAEQGYRLTPP